MNRLPRFILRTLIVGFIAMLPVGLVILGLAKSLRLVAVMMNPLFKLAPGIFFDNPLFQQIMTVVVLLLLLFLIGLLARTVWGQRFGRRIEQDYLSRVPLYDLFRSFASRLAGASDAHRFQPVVVTTRAGFRQFGFVVERHASGLYTVFVPSAPSLATGAVYVVEADSVAPLSVSPAKVALCVTHWGEGSEALIQTLESGLTQPQ